MGAPERDDSALPPLRGGARVAAAVWVAAVVALYWAVQLGALRGLGDVSGMGGPGG